MSGTNLEPTNLLDEAILDFATFTLRHQVWISKQEMWRKWIRSN